MKSSVAMRLDERIVIRIPPSVRDATPRKRSTWIRHAILRGIWDVRNKYLVEGVDIFNVFTMTDCVEVNLNGEVEAMPISDEKRYSIRGMIRQRLRKREDEE